MSRPHSFLGLCHHFCLEKCSVKKLFTTLKCPIDKGFWTCYNELEKGGGGMKKLLVLLICLLALSAASCEKENARSTSDDTQGLTEESASAESVTEESVTEEATAEESATKETAADVIAPYFYISELERMTWKEKIIDVVSSLECYEEKEYGCLGVALMDLNFDNMPELVVTYMGGSMHNVGVKIYDLESGEELSMLGATPGYGYADGNLYLCMRRSDEGNYIIVNEGGLRDGLMFFSVISTLNDQFKLDTVFVKGEDVEGNISYYCGGNEVDKTEFEKQKNQFENDYKEITETQIKVVLWDSIDADNKSEAISMMADALINSEQQFIKFDK